MPPKISPSSEAKAGKSLKARKSPKAATPSKADTSSKASSKVTPQVTDDLIPAIPTFERPLSTMLKRPAQNLAVPQVENDHSDREEHEPPLSKRPTLEKPAVVQTESNHFDQGEHSNEPCCSHNKTSKVDLNLSQGAFNPFDMTNSIDEVDANPLAVTLSNDIQDESQNNEVERRLSLMLK